MSMIRPTNKTFIGGLLKSIIGRHPVIWSSMQMHHKCPWVTTLKIVYELICHIFYQATTKQFWHWDYSLQRIGWCCNSITAVPLLHQWAHSTQRHRHWTTGPLLHHLVHPTQHPWYWTTGSLLLHLEHSRDIEVLILNWDNRKYRIYISGFP